MSLIMVQKCIMPDCDNQVSGKGRHGPRKFCDDCSKKRSSVQKMKDDGQIKCMICGSLFIPHSSAPKSGKYKAKKCNKCKNGKQI